MSSSKSKITSVACPKCKQDFKFKRVPQMASITCPHCSTKIRLTRKKNDSTPPKLPAENQAETHQKKLPVPGLPQPATPTPDSNQPPTTHPAEEFSSPLEIKTRRTRKRINLSGLQLDDSDTTAPDPPKQKDHAADNQDPDDNFHDSKTPADPKRQPTSAPPTEVQPTANDQSAPVDDSTIIPSGRRSRSKSKVQSTQPQTLAAKHTDAAPEIAAPIAEAKSTDPLRLATPSQVASSPIPSTPAEPPLENNEANTNTKATDTELDDDSNSLLPPKFLVADIEADENAVVLPTATGGTQVVDRTEVTVSHGGQTVTLIASTPEELKRIRLIENLVALAIAGIMLAIAVWLVL